MMFSKEWTHEFGFSFVMFLYCMVQAVQIDHLYKILQKFGGMNSPPKKVVKQKLPIQPNELVLIWKLFLFLCIWICNLFLCAFIYVVMNVDFWFWNILRCGMVWLTMRGRQCLNTTPYVFVPFTIRLKVLSFIVHWKLIFTVFQDELQAFHQEMVCNWVLGAHNAQRESVLTDFNFRGSSEWWWFRVHRIWSFMSCNCLLIHYMS